MCARRWALGLFRVLCFLHGEHVARKGLVVLFSMPPDVRAQVPGTITRKPATIGVDGGGCHCGWRNFGPQFASEGEVAMKSSNDIKLQYSGLDQSRHHLPCIALWALQNSATGTRTRVARVRAEYPNQLDYSGLVR